MLGLLVGIGVSTFFVYVAFLLLAKVLEINSDKIIFIIAAAPIIFLWHHGNQSWTQYGEVDLLYAFVSIVTWPWEVAGGLENLLELETGTLGGWPAN